jgi:hypothetical protein
MATEIMNTNGLMMRLSGFRAASPLRCMIINRQEGTATVVRCTTQCCLHMSMVYSQVVHLIVSR